MLKVVIWMISLFVVVGCGKNIKVIEKNENGQVLQSYYLDSDSLIHGILEKYYENGNLLERSNYHRGQLDGKRALYYPSGTMEILEKYCLGILCDTLFTYYNSGQVKSSSLFKNGSQSGEMYLYYKNGRVKEVANFEENEENGPFKEYYESGQLMWEGTYLHGDNEFGLLTHYDENGNIIKKMMCDSLSICQTIWTPKRGNIKIEPLVNLSK